WLPGERASHSLAASAPAPRRRTAMPISADRWYAEIESSTDILAGIVDGADLTIAVPTCPEWTLRQLATHVGRAHRWAGQITSTRSSEFIPFRQVPDGRIPDDPAKQAPWLRAGAARLVDAVRAADGDHVWTFNAQRPASFWARRMAHETAVHRADAELTVGRDPRIAADVAADGIDEWLGFLSAGAAAGGAAEDARLAAMPDGGVLHFHATDDGLPDGAGEWLVRRDGDRITVEHGHAKGDVVLRGPAGRVLLVLVRRLPADDAQVEVLGDPAVLTAWLAATPF
ncbi:MAG TPA: maleylpyruvate isomerase family mycothiol-dependent enzyme, partial [Streptosporangiaceae bacterium]|nr:maleylpyruvate isomerase family mycothiol-dependent enzyme [Streptosporangiaceae bacterium]